MYTYVYTYMYIYIYIYIYTLSYTPIIYDTVYVILTRHCKHFIGGGE